MKKSYVASVLPIAGILAVLTGCTSKDILRPDLGAECGSPLACQVGGIDLVVAKPRLLFAPGYVTDPVTGRPVIPPGQSFRYVVSVWNRGSETSAEDSLFMGSEKIVVPPLKPGATVTDTLERAAPTDMGLREDTTWIDAWLWDWRAEDPFNGNDAMSSDTFIVALPVLHVSLVAPDTVREEVPFTASITVKNQSRFAQSGGRSVAFCLFYSDVGCGSWAGAPFQLMDVPAIPAGGTWSTTMTMVVPKIDVRYYAEFNWYLAACFADKGTTLEQMLDWRNRSCVDDARYIHVRAAAQ